MRDRLVRERAEEVGRLHNLRYELKCSRSRDDWGDASNDGDGEWRPAHRPRFRYGDLGQTSDRQVECSAQDLLAG
jgi:hypothetical protein